MRTLMLVAILTVPFGCAHRESRSLAQRQSVTTPHGDFEGPPRDERRDRNLPRGEPPIVTPPVP
ncbi:MAG: hypothetical protein JWM53_3055 [bacterium]|nr:hypothetical protein [bacterium]